MPPEPSGVSFSDWLLLGLLLFLSPVFRLLPSVPRRPEVGGAEAKATGAGADEAKVDIPEVYALGLLGSYDLEPLEDHWMATDFIALREVIGADDERSHWLCGKSIHEGRHLIGHPESDRLILDSQPCEMVVTGGPEILKTNFVVKVTQAASKLCPGDALILVLVGHGDELDGSLLVGGFDFSIRCTKAELEICVADTRGEVYLINTGCFSGTWTSPHWTMLAAAAEDQRSFSLPVSGSGEYRGGFFTAALLAEHANENSLSAPCPGLADEKGRRRQQQKHDFGPDKPTTPIPRSPKRSLRDVRDWISRYRDYFDGEHSDPTFSHCDSNEPHTLPFKPLTTRARSFHQFPCDPPSLPQPLGHQTLSESFTGEKPSTTPSQPNTGMTVAEEAELLTLAQNHINSSPPPIPSEIPVTTKCWTVVYGRPGGSLDDAKKRYLLLQLKERAHRWRLAGIIASRLGWVEGGVPSHEQRWRITRDDQRLQKEAEESGCLLKALYIFNNYRRWEGAASWLAHIWEAAGCPGVTPETWKLAIEGMGL